MKLLKIIITSSILLGYFLISSITSSSASAAADCKRTKAETLEQCDGRIKNCSISPINPKIGDEITIKLIVDENYGVESYNYWGRLDGADIAKTGSISVKPRKDKNFSAKLTEWKLDKYGVYGFDFQIDYGHCIIPAAFMIKNPTSKAKFKEPASVINTEFKDIPLIQISGLDEKARYKLKLISYRSGFKEIRDGTRSDQEIWTTDDDGILTIENVCRNGWAKFASDNTPKTECNESFVNGQYGISIYKIDGSQNTYLDSYLFKVSSDITTGQNPCGGGECRTALGNIPIQPGTFVNRILLIATSLAGGIALILMVIGAIRVLTSSGDQQKLSGGRDMIVAAIAGLLFLIFSVLILKFLGLTFGIILFS